MLCTIILKGMTSSSPCFRMCCVMTTCVSSLNHSSFSSLYGKIFRLLLKISVERSYWWVSLIFVKSTPGWANCQTKTNTAVHSHLVLGAPFMGYAHPHVRTIGPSAIATAYRKSKLSLAPCILAGACLSRASGNTASTIDSAQMGVIKIYRIRRITVNGMSFF